MSRPSTRYQNPLDTVPDAPVLPSSIDSERAVLCAALLFPDTLDDAVCEVAPDDFYLETHEIIFREMLALHAAGAAIDYISLERRLKADERFMKLVELPGTFLSDLVDGRAPVHHVEYHARQIAGAAKLRRLARRAVDLARECLEPGAEADLVVAQAEADVLAIGEHRQAVGPRPFGEVAFEALARYEQQAAGEIPPGLGTGLGDVDHILHGLHASDLVVLAARPAMGKSALAAQIGYHVALGGKSVLMFALEMSSAQLAERLLSAEARVDFQRFRHGKLEAHDHRRVVDTYAANEAMPLYLDDRADLTVAEVRSTARRLRRERGLDLVIVDYLQLMTSRGLFRASDRVREIGSFSRGLKLLARELDIPVLALSQLSRACETRPNKRPLLSDLRESGDVEQDADVVAFLYRHEVYEDVAEHWGKAEFIVRKQRNGPVGTVPLTFVAERVRFESAQRY